MNNDFLLDTNLLVYAIDRSSKFHTATLQFIDEATESLYTTTKNISEFLVVTTRGDVPMLNMEEALNEVDRFQLIMEVITPTDSSFSTFKSILNKYKPRGKKIHDFEIVAIVLSYHITQIVTFNSSDFDKIEEITCVVPQ